MKKRYITFFDKEREIISDLPWGEDNLVVVLATDLQRLERARFAFTERVGRMLRTTAEHREEQEKSLRELNSMVIGIRPTSIPPKFLDTAVATSGGARRAPPSRPPARSAKKV